MGWPSDHILKNLNRALLVIIIGSNGFLLLAPLWPKLNFAVQTHITKPVSVHIESVDSLAGIDRSYNHLIVPRLQLDSAVLDGSDEHTVNRGIWRLPNSAQPGQGSNTVLVGHRFTYSGPSVFYNLDKVQPGDDVLLVYSHKLYVFKVDANRTVVPTDLSVEAPSSREKLTIYTCTPLWSVRYRLVIDSHLERTL